MSDFKLDFQDTATAFADKTNSELREKYRIFRMMNSPTLVSLGTRAMNFALKVGLPVTGLIKHTVFEQFCGGETIGECQKTIEKLGRSQIGTILDYSVEGKSEEEDFEATKEEVIRTIKRAAEDDKLPFSVFKVTGIAPLGTLEKVSSGIELPEKSKFKWERIQSRVGEICEYAHTIGQPVFIDAEDYYVQEAIDQLADAMMESHNGERTLVFNTIQLYRKDRLEFLRKSHQTAREKGYFYGVKLVRGAYMEKERERAAELGYPSPIHETKEDTDRDYDAAIEYCLDNLNDLSFVAATHNERSTQFLVREMKRRGLPNDHPRIFFSQLYGMSDNLSYVLAKNGYNVSKYVPYGPVKDAMPYLIRRAQENTSVAGQVSRELDLIQRELRRRKNS